MRFASVVAICALLAGCGTARPITATASCSEPAPAAEPTVPTRQPAPEPAPPEGYLSMAVETVIPSLQGNALILVDAERRWALPVIIGDAEAHIIQLRLRGERFERPLTHDLLDRMVRELGGEVLMVQVNKLSGGIFVGSIFLWDGEQMLRIDARTSDAVAVALGHDVPVYVDAEVVRGAGISPNELLPGGAPWSPTIFSRRSPACYDPLVFWRYPWPRDSLLSRWRSSP